MRQCATLIVLIQKKMKKNKNTNRDEIHNEFEFKHLFLNKQADISRIAYEVCGDSNKSIDWLHFILKHKQCNLNQKHEDNYRLSNTVFKTAWANSQWDKVSFLFVWKHCVFVLNL